MTYYDFMKRATEEVVSQADNGLYYLEPAFRIIMVENGLSPKHVDDVELNWDGVKEYLELYVVKLNTESNKMPAVVDWLHKIVTTAVEPEIQEEETEFIKNFIEYTRTKK